MKKNKNFLNNDLLILKKNIYYLFKQKIKKEKYKLNINQIFKFIKLFKIYIYMQSNLLNLFFYKYNIIKILWYFYITIFNWRYEIVKIKISKFFKQFLNKNIVNNLFILNNNIKFKLTFLFSKKFNLNFLENKKVNLNLNLIKTSKKKKKKNLKFNF